MNLDSFQVFLSYATPDRERVEAFYEDLQRRGFRVWMDSKEILPGQNWDFEIKRELAKSSVVIAFLSNTSINRRGYVQRELTLALDAINDRLIDDVYLIPVVLDDGLEIPQEIKGIHAIYASASDCLGKIGQSLTAQANKLGVEARQSQALAGLTWSFNTLREVYDGIPGYEVELRLIEFKSDTYHNVAEVGQYIRAQFLGELFRHRSDRLLPTHGFYNFGQDRFRRTNTYDAHCREPRIKGRMLSVEYTVNWYGAGAAHPNHHFST